MKIKFFKRCLTALVCCLAAGCMALTFAACANDNTPSGGTEDIGGVQQPDTPETPDEPEQPEQPEEGGVFVVYFSATGNTENVAEYIADYTGGDIFELVPEDPYMSDDLRWTDDNSRVVREYEAKQAGTLQTVQLVEDTVENWAEYDTVFLGFPIWWYEAAWPVYDFAESNDFTGKTVYTFCTSSSSGLGNSTQVLANMAGGSGNWQDGRRFSSGASRSIVESWLEGLNIA